MRKIVLAGLLAIIAISAAWGQSGPPPLISYQGQLLGPGGTPVAADTEIRFTLLWGGDDTENPSTGKPVYQENAVAQTDASGVFHHLLGTGTPTGFCDEDRDGVAAEICVLATSDFPSNAIPLYLELRVDPAGANNLLIPRQRIATVPYAFNAGSVQGMPAAEFITGVNPGTGLNGGGTTGDVTVSIAFGGVGSQEIADSSVTSQDIAVDTITAADIAPGAVGSSEISDNSILSQDIATDTVTAADIATDGVASAEILNGSVASIDIAPDTIADVDIAPGAVGSSEIADGSVATADIAAGAVTNNRLALTPSFSPQVCTTSVTTASTNLGPRNFCALHQMGGHNFINDPTSLWCDISLVTTNWVLSARSNGTTTVCCNAVCF